ncbi:MAG TPA: hypothetical protein VMT62_05500 [Syntrophorhabdaceae bacterium]|nr:hypothetical protein [Syntrophorhabdaceae bacterium]
MKKKKEKPKKKNVEIRNEEESMRFIEKAKELHTKGTDERFEQACAIIMKKKHPQ